MTLEDLDLSYLSPSDTELVRKAYSFADKAHGGQKRLTGEPFIEHPLRAAKILADLKVDATTLAAALLHDVLEDTQTTSKDIDKTFGAEITRIVQGVSKLRPVHLTGSSDEEHLEAFRRMILAMAKDVRVILIKLADRLDNLETLSGLSPDRQIRYASEILEIYAPIASRLGIGQIKGKMEDLAFPFVYPEEFKWVKELVGSKIRDREEFVEKVKRTLLSELGNAGVKVIDADSRVKHLYSLYTKLQRKDKDLSRVNDLVALRIVVPTVTDCYTTLGIIHKLWRPVPGSFDDYIANPKPNGYRSLHTDVFAMNDQIVEIQIRTPEMHQEAEFGVVAHWHYETVKSEESKRAAGIPKHKLVWIQALSKALQSGEELSSLKLDFFKDRIFVFTPQGDVIDLPEGATAVDFAYAVHSDVGNRCMGAKVNGKIIELHEPLQSGAVVEILTGPKAKPSRDWLNFAKTSHAREQIRRHARL
jgi:guanosine-3',5'-bis(diphosphate) 3'-pyrophosphohydrolase